MHAVKRRFPLYNNNVTKLRRAIISDDLLRKAMVAPEVLKPFVNRPELWVKDYFKINELVTISDLFDARVHYGHKVGTCHENMKWALYGERQGVCIFDLDITKKYMIRAMEFLAHMASRGAIFLFVTADKTNMLMVEKMAIDAGHYAHVRKWAPNTFDIKKKIGINARIPDVMVLLSAQSAILGPHPAIYDAARYYIPTVGVCDSNANPRMVTYAVPGNDDTPSAVNYYMTKFLEAIKRGQDNPMRTKSGHWVY